jgi:DNA-binding IclR family transcriptional regulator
MRIMKITDSAGTRELPDTDVGVLDRAVAILDAVEHGARSHAAVVRATDLSRTTAHRLLKSLEAHGLVDHVGGRGYRLGSRLLRLGASSLREPALRDVAHGALERLAAVTGESAQLFVMSAGERVCIDAVQSSNELRTMVEVGAVLPVTAGSAGKIFMAWATDPARRTLVRQTRPLTDRTPTGQRLERQLATARRQGWIASAGERQAGVGSVSAPILGRLGDLVAVVSISGPTTRIGAISAKRYAPAVVTAAHEIERALGI